MAAASRHQQACAIRPVLGKDATMPSPYVQAPARSTQTDRRVASPSLPRIPAKTAHRRTGQPRASTDSGAFLMAGRFHRPRSQRNSNFRNCLVPRHLIRQHLRRETCRLRHPCQRPLCAFSRALAGSTPGARTVPRIELASLPEGRDEARLLYDMGWETANMHFGSRNAVPK